LGAGFGRARPLDRWRGPALGHPLAGQAGPPPATPPPLDPPPLDLPPLDPPELDPREPELDGRGAGRLTGGMDPLPRLWLLTGGGPADKGADGRAGEGAGGADAALGRGPVPGDAVPAERPAPRDQPEAGADADPPDPFGPPAPLAPCRGGRSSGGATRPLAPSASVTFLVRAEPGPGTPPTTRR
jgi:hypothetical protein